MILNNVAKFTETQAREYLEKLRWPDGAVCPHCGSKNATKLNNTRSGSRKLRSGLYKCRSCRKQFTVTVGTIFEGSRIPIRTWLIAYSLMCASKKGISAHQIHRMLGITYKTSWFMCHRIRHTMAKEPLKGKLSGALEADETYIGGKKNNWHNSKRRFIKQHPQIPASYWDNKSPVLALVERDGNIRTKVVANVTSKNLRDFLTENANKDSSILYTDECSLYRPIGKEFIKHKKVMHCIRQYVQDDAHINTAESFFSLLKRGVMGSFHHVSKEHLPRYCNEFAWRWCRRRVSDEERTINTLQNIEGKRLMYREPLEKAS